MVNVAGENACVDSTPPAIMPPAAYATYIHTLAHSCSYIDHLLQFAHHYVHTKWIFKRADVRYLMKGASLVCKVR
jgi:hypothetical protein